MSRKDREGQGEGGRDRGREGGTGGGREGQGEGGRDRRREGGTGGGRDNNYVTYLFLVVDHPTV